MKIHQVMVAPVVTCRAEDSLDTVARLMWEADIGALPVVDGVGRVVGMITDRDVCMAAYLRGASLRELCAGDGMARNVIACRPEDPVGVARELMSEHQIHRLPVLDLDHRPVGMITLNDLAQEAELEHVYSDSELRLEDIAIVLAAIGTPRTPREPPSWSAA